MKTHLHRPAALHRHRRPAHLQRQHHRDRHRLVPAAHHHRPRTKLTLHQPGPRPKGPRSAPHRSNPRPAGRRSVTWSKRLHGIADAWFTTRWPPLVDVIRPRRRTPFVVPETGLDTISRQRGIKHRTVGGIREHLVGRRVGHAAASRTNKSETPGRPRLQLVGKSPGPARLLQASHPDRPPRAAAPDPGGAKTNQNTQPRTSIIDDHVGPKNPGEPLDRQRLGPRSARAVGPKQPGEITLALALRGAGCRTDIAIFPEDGQPDLVARVALGHPAPLSSAEQALVAAIPHRHTNRYPFTSSAIPADTLEQLIDAARQEAAVLTVANPVSRNAIIGLSQAADRRQRATGGYRAELARWTTHRTLHRDGIPPSAIGPWDAMEIMPIRDFGLLQPHLARAPETFETHPTLMVLATAGDDRKGLGPRRAGTAASSADRDLAQARHHTDQPARRDPRHPEAIERHDQGHLGADDPARRVRPSRCRHTSPPSIRRPTARRQ
jgi:hypothetical protein